MLRWFCCLAIVWSWVSAASYMPLAENFILVQGAQVSLKGASVSLELRLDNNGDVREIFIETEDLDSAKDLACFLKTFEKEVFHVNLKMLELSFNNSYKPYSLRYIYHALFRDICHPRTFMKLLVDHDDLLRRQATQAIRSVSSVSGSASSAAPRAPSSVGPSIRPASQSASSAAKR